MKNLPVILLSLAIVVFIVWLVRNKFKKFISYLTYSLVSIRIHNKDLWNTIHIKAGISVNNPSDTSVSVKEYKAELYLGQGEKRKLLATTPISSLTIPAKKIITHTFDFYFKPLALLSLSADLLQQGIAALKGQLTIIIKADVAGQFITKEFKY